MGHSAQLKTFRSRNITKLFYLCRCCQIFKTVRLIRRIKGQTSDDKERYRLYIAQLQDASTLGVLEAFMEEAPQVTEKAFLFFCDPFHH